MIYGNKTSSCSEWSTITKENKNYINVRYLHKHVTPADKDNFIKIPRKRSPRAMMAAWINLSRYTESKEKWIWGTEINEKEGHIPNTYLGISQFYKGSHTKACATTMEEIMTE